MNVYTRAALAAVALVGCVAASTGSAFAWGCVAVSEDGTYGYSYNYGDRDSAIERALNECATRATTDQTCEITDCSEDS